MKVSSAPPSSKFHIYYVVIFERLSKANKITKLISIEDAKYGEASDSSRKKFFFKKLFFFNLKLFYNHM